MDDQLSLEWDQIWFYINLGEQTLQLSREEAEGLFIVLGNGLIDQDNLRKEVNDGDAELES